MRDEIDKLILNFNPRSPCGERLCRAFVPVNGAVNISIHAPRAGSDYTLTADIWATRNFNPRSPCGERPDFFDSVTNFFAFQSTLPVRGATIHADT